MPGESENIKSVRSALFVDFDNIYSRLYEEEPEAATGFATNPSKWLLWLRRNISYGDLTQDPVQVNRRILVRRVYFNPAVYGRYRPDFIRSAFQVVDCPPLTAGGKTSTDIHMVMDILDALNHATHFDEFILLSGDADFTPVLLRLSQHDRRSAVLAVGPASAAYKAACDCLLDQDAFLEDGIGMKVGQPSGVSLRETGPPEPRVTSQLLRRISDKVYETASTSGELLATELPAIYRQFSEFTPNSNWLGFYSLRRLTETVVASRDDLHLVEGDPWRVAVRGVAPVVIALPEAIGPRTPATATEPGSAEALRRRILDSLRSMVVESGVPVPMARAAHHVLQQVGQGVLTSRWAGAGTFKDLLSEMAEPNIAVSLVDAGYLYDPGRHEPPVSDRRVDDLELRHPSLAPTARRIHQITDTPYLTPEQYALVFRTIAEEVNQHGFQINRTSKAVRDRCIEEGMPIGRVNVNFVLRGISYAGHRFGDRDSETTEQLAREFHANVRTLCETAQLQLTSEEETELHHWILGGVGGPSLPHPAAVD